MNFSPERVVLRGSALENRIAKLQSLSKLMFVLEVEVGSGDTALTLRGGW